jgi:hypothetical protein
MARDFRRQIEVSAAELRRLKARVDETFARRADGPQARRDWDQACADFHAAYDALAFPGGYVGAFERLAAGDAHAMEAALTFLELRPYFFRSGYMFKKLLRYAHRAPFDAAQARRFAQVKARAAEWRALRHGRPGPAVSLDELFAAMARRGCPRARG